MVGKMNRLGGEQFDHAVALAHGIGLDESALIHGLRVQGDGPGIGDEAAGVVDGTLGQPDPRAQAAAVGIFRHEHFFAGVEAQRAVRGHEGAVVLDFFGHEEERAAALRFNFAIIDDARRRWRAAVSPVPATVVAGHGHGRSRDEQATHLHHRIRPKIKAGLVEEHHEAVGVQVAENLRGIFVRDAIPRHRGGGGLDEGGGLPGGNVEAGPVDDRVVSGPHGRVRTVPGDGGVAATDGAASGTGLRRRCAHPETGQGKQHASLHAEHALLMGEGGEVGFHTGRLVFVLKV